MSPLVSWFVGFIAVVLVIIAQMILPFAFDFVTTLMVYGLGVYIGKANTKG